jgi:putative transcriptional regulator
VSGPQDTGPQDTGAQDAGAQDAGDAPDRPGESTAIAIHLDALLADRGLTLTELAARVDITVVNLSVLKNGRARAIRFSTLARLCDALACQPGDLLRYRPPTAARHLGANGTGDAANAQ